MRKTKSCWLDYVDAHGAGRAFDLVDDALQVEAIQVGHFDLGDLFHLLQRDLADAVLVRLSRALGQVDGALDVEVREDLLRLARLVLGFVANELDRELGVLDGCVPGDARPLLFEIGRLDATGVDLPVPVAQRTSAGAAKSRLGGMARTKPIGLPGLSEPETMRHYVRLSQKNYAIDAGLYPLGSCTMKHNPRLNEKVARLPGIGDLHPLQPVSTVQGALELIDRLAHWLKTLTGMPAVAMSPAAGAHGEMCGMMTIAAALDAKGERARRKVVLAPESAHGTNPATAAALRATYGDAVALFLGGDRREETVQRLGQCLSASGFYKQYLDSIGSGVE